jgi:hypothetical protein
VRSSRVRTAIVSTLLAALSACACDTVPDAAVTDCDAQIVPGGSAVDILFVVDDSGSMREEQDELAKNLGDFVDALVNAPVRLDVRIGVTNTSVHGFTGGTTYGAPFGGVDFPGVAGTPYPAGALVAIADPEGVVTAGHFVWDPVTSWGGSRILSNGSTLARDFKANVLQGVWGSGKEQPLSAMRKALEQSTCPGVNCGFLRDGARLAVVILTDEDDCSSDVGTVADDAACRTSPALEPLADYVSFLDTVTQGDPPIVALIAGFDAQNAVSACSGSAFGTSTSARAEPRRLDDFVELLGTTRTVKDSICESFGPSLLAIATKIIPQTMPLEQAPQDWRMLAVALNRGGSTVPCRLALAGSPDAGAADVLFTPPQPGTSASLTFQNGCTLGVRDRVDLRIVCAR